MTLTIWHNPRCSKSRETLALLRERGFEPEIRDYLAHPPSEAELRAAVDALGLDTPRRLMRTGEPVYRENGLAAVKNDAALIAAMAAHPVLIERPIVIRGARAVLGRPPANVLSLL